jgi:DNA-binding NarL/FixJ family response regulator
MGITVLIIDSERIFADAVAIHLDEEPDISVLASLHPDARGEVQLTGRHADVALLDADLPGGIANSLCAEVTSYDRPSAVVMLSRSSEPERVLAAIRSGASAWVRKDESFDYLLRVIRGAVRGETWLPPASTGAVLRMLMRAQDRRREDNDLLAALTPREREVLWCLADGAGRRDVAEQLFLSANTVRTHLQNLMAKLGVHSAVEAVALCRRAGPETTGAAPR